MPKGWIFVANTSAQICGADSLPSEPGDFPLPRKIGRYLCNLAILIINQNISKQFILKLHKYKCKNMPPSLTLRIRSIREIRFRMRTFWRIANKSLEKPVPITWQKDTKSISLTWGWKRHIANQVTSSRSACDGRSRFRGPTVSVCIFS